MYFVYILKSLKNQRYYTGSTGDLEKRLKEHNSGKIKSTKNIRPLEIVYFEKLTTNIAARRCEKQIKRQKSRKHIESLIKLEEEKNRSVA